MATDRYSKVTASALDAAGNVYLAGSFTNSVELGGTTLTSLGNTDVFVAKYDPTSHQFVWAQRAGGLAYDVATALVVIGNSVYVAGNFQYYASFGATTLTTTGQQDMFVAKLTDAGPTGSFVWAQQAGGTGVERATGLAVNGTSVYLAGNFDGPSASFGAIALTNTTTGRDDGFVAKLTDAGSTSSFVWAQQTGGAGSELVYALAVNGANVYVTGDFDGPSASFGAATLTNTSRAQQDVFVAKLTDAGPTGSFVWAQRAGGMGGESANSLAVSGNNVYIAGYFHSPTASFGVNTLATAGFLDGFVAKLTDAGPTGSFVWAQRAGGTYNDIVNTVTVSGNNVYVAGGYSSITASFGATTLTNVYSNGVNYDVFVAKLTDAGPTGSFVWAQGAGSEDSEEAYGLAVSGNNVYVTGAFNGFRTGFGAITLLNPYYTIVSPVGFLATLTDHILTATAAGRAPTPVQLFPNPARQSATLRLAPGTTPSPLSLTDAQGRIVRRYPAPTRPEATLSLWGLPAGLYLLRGAGPAQRLVVE